MKRKVMATLAAWVIMFGGAGMAEAALLTFADEAGYLAAVSAYGIVTEGFETADWDPSRPSGATSITSKGLTWTAGDLIATGTGWSRSGTYGLFDSFGDPDSIHGASSVTTLYGVGGWFAGSFASDLTLSLDSTDVLTLSPTSVHQFAGVVETSGFASFSFSTSSGHWGADDITVATVIPEPITFTLLPLASLALVMVRRRW